MARAATTSDVFNAIAEPRRRQIIDLLSRCGERDVTHLVTELQLSQPAVSKHLGVLREVGIVEVTRHGRNRLYRLNPHKLKPVHDWTKTFEHFWSRQLDRIRTRAERAAGQLPGHHPHEP